jgi:hypothetical protein
MKIRCISNTGASLRSYEYEPITNKKEVFGRFGVSEIAEYEIEIGKEYLVMGLITFQTYQAYLIDDNGFISACPCQLFEVVDNKVNSNWNFRLIEKDEDIYPFVQAILGYPELSADKRAYENLIVEMEENAQRTYFRRKIELEKELEE